MRSAPRKVGELAKQTGLSVRTLHYYDEIGLLSPSYRTETGYRLYVAGDIARLQQIKSLRQLGLSLEEIRDCLNRPDFSPLHVIQRHIARLREQIALQQQLCQRLEALAASLSSASDVSAEEFLKTIEVMHMVEKYYTPEQMEEIKERGRQLGEDKIRQAEAEWQEIIAQVRAEMDKGTDPASAPVRRLAQRWRELVNAFTGGNPEIHKALQKMWHEEENIHGMDTRAMREMWEYLARGNPAAEKAE
jgi:DNA-binding transcriptional MerR regulator